MTGNRRAAALGLVAVLGLAGCAPGAAGSGSQGSGPAEGSAARQEAAPKEEAEPVAEHDYETEWFYVDVPDGWTYSEDGGPNTWFVEGPTEADDGAVEYRFHVTGANVGADGNVGGDTVIVGGPRLEQYSADVGPAPDGTAVYLFSVGAPFFARDGRFEGDDFVTIVNGVTDPDLATIALKTAEAEDSGAPSVDEAFVAKARSGLSVPDDPSITYSVDGPFLWEAEGKYLPFIEFYQNGEPVASALCWEDGTPARSIYAYTAPE